MYDDNYLLFYKKQTPPLPSDNIIKLYFKMVADSITLKDMTAIELCWHCQGLPDVQSSFESKSMILDMNQNKVKSRK